MRKALLHELLRFAGCAAAATFVGALLVLPQWVHTLDEGQARLRPSEVVGRRDATRRVTLDGVFLHDNLVQVWETKHAYGEHRTSEWRLFPIVDEGARPEDPVPVVYQASASSELTRARVDQPLERIPLEGIVRDVLWEGDIPEEALAVFDELGIELAPDVVLVSDKGLGFDRFWAWVVTFPAFFIGLFLAEQWRLAARKRRVEDARESAEAKVTSAAPARRSRRYP